MFDWIMCGKNADKNVDNSVLSKSQIFNKSNLNSLDNCKHPPRENLQN